MWALYLKKDGRRYLWHLVLLLILASEVVINLLFLSNVTYVFNLAYKSVNISNCMTFWGPKSKKKVMKNHVLGCCLCHFWRPLLVVNRKVGLFSLIWYLFKLWFVANCPCGLLKSKEETVRLDKLFSPNHVNYKYSWNPTY